MKRKENREGKEIKGIQIGKEEVKLSLFAHNMILNVEILTSYQKTTRAHQWIKVAECKINTQKHLALLYTNSESSAREIKEIIPLIIA